MEGLRELACHAEAGSSLAFRATVYRRGEQGELLRDVISLANASAPGPRFLIMGIEDGASGREFRGITPRSWRSFCEALPEYLARTIEPALAVRLDSLLVGEALIGVLCLDPCEDPPYLLARRVSPSMPAGGGWIRRGTQPRRLLRRHLQGIFAARFARDALGEITVGFPGDLPRDEVELAPLPLEALPSRAAAARVERMLQAKRVAKSVLGRTDSRIARLVHAQVNGEAMPYREQGTKTLMVMLDRIPLEQAAADAHHQFEQRAHRLNVVLASRDDKAHTDLTLTLKFPRVAGFDVVQRVCAAPGAWNPRHRLYPKVDHGPRTIAVQASGLRLPRRGTLDAFIEPLRVIVREAAAGCVIRVAYSLQGATLARPLRGRLKILVTD